MGIGFRASATVTNGTAGTSVTVSKPAGTTDGDMLVAFIARNGTTGPSGVPTGWSLVATAANASGPTLAAYVKVASGEPANWTWTITSSINWGVVCAYTGVDPSIPVAATVTSTPGAGTVFAPGPVSLPRFGRGVSAAAAIRTASGVATTWSPSGTERADVSTNVGSGTDIAGEVQDTQNPVDYDTTYQGVLTASQSQTTGAAIGLSLNAYFALPKPADVIPSIVEVAFGADLTAAPNTWTWTDISSRVKGQIKVARGRPDENGQTTPSKLNLRLDNTDGWLTPLNPNSPWYNQWDLDTPIRVKLRHPLADFLRFQGSVSAGLPDWPAGNDTSAFIDLEAQGALGTMTSTEPLVSVLTRGISGQYYNANVAPLLYYPFEDDAGATSAAEYFGGAPLVPHGGTVTFAGDSSLVASKPLAKLGAGTALNFTVPTYTHTGSWRVEFVASLPTTPSVDVNMAFWLTTGASANLWKVRYDQASATFRLQALGPSGEVLGDTGIAAAGLYGKVLFFVADVQQSGADINWELQISAPPYSTLSGSTGTKTGFTLGPLQRGTVQATAASDGMVFGHLALLSNADTYGGGTFSNFDWTYLDAFANEDATGRIVRVLGENGVTMDSPVLHNDPQHFMGPQPLAPLITVLRECEAVDNGILCDGMGPGVTYLPLGARLNAAVRLALDVNRRHLKLPFLPVRDRQRALDDMTMSRSGGSSGRFRTGAGRNPGQATINPLNDSVLVDQAAFRVRLGTVREMRAPTISLNLRDTPELIPQWFRCDIGSRFTAANLMNQFPAGGLDQVIESYVETFDGITHTVDIQSFPFAPFRTFIVGDPAQGRLGTDNSYLQAALTSTATTLTATSGDGTPWSTSALRPADLPLDIDLEGEQVRVAAVSNLVTDTFTRTTASGWGTADSGQTWTVSGGVASDYSTNGTKGVLSLGSVNVMRTATLALGIADFDLSTSRIGIGVTPTGAPIDYVLRGRINGSDFVDGRLFFGTSGKFTLAIRQFVGGVETLVGFYDAWVPPFGFPAFRVQAIGSTLRARAWQAGKPEPKDWAITQTVTHLAAGSVMVGALLESGNTNTLPVAVDFEDVMVVNPQTVTVQRSINGVVKAHNALAPISRWKPAALAL